MIVPRKKRSPADGGLRRLFFARLKTDAQWTPIETGAIQAGVPDAEYCFGNGAQGWIEFKATDSWAVAIKPLQVAWIERRARYGGRVTVAVRRCNGDVDELWLVPGRQASQLRESGLQSLLAPVFTGGPRRWPWERIRGLLGG